MNKWLVVGTLALAQFIMVLDSTVMNVSLSTITHDLNTTISTLQTAITFYALVMAAFMLTGGKLGDIWGREKAFRIGGIIYGLGSLITALSPNIQVLFVGWSVIEGLGAVLVIPAIVALIASNYSGKDRVVSYAMIGAASGVAAAAGPLIGGFFTTFLSWRYVFAIETLVMIIVLLVTRKIKPPKKSNVLVRLDMWSVILSAIGLTSLVYGILQSKTWGWITPLTKPVIFGHEVAPFGISIVAYLILIGFVILWMFYDRQEKLEAKKGFPLLRVSMLSIKQLRSGIVVLLAQYFMIAALFFVIPVYLQMVLGLDALATGVKILPLSVGLVLFSIIGSRMVKSVSPRRIVRFGQVLLFLGSIVLLAAVDPQLRSWSFAFGMFFVGGGFGILASQINNINISAVDSSEASEVGGLQGTFQNLGSSLGTALVGSILIASLTSGFVKAVNANPNIPGNVKQQVQNQTKAGVSIVSAQQVEQYALKGGVSQNQAEQIAGNYANAQIESLRISLFFLVIFSLFSLLFARNLPNVAPKKL